MSSFLPPILAFIVVFFLIFFGSRFIFKDWGSSPQDLWNLVVLSFSGALVTVGGVLAIFSNWKKIFTKSENRNVVVSPGSIITDHQKGNNILINPTVELRPELRYLQERTSSEIDKESGLYQTHYYFGSAHNLPLTNVSIKLDFREVIKDFRISIIGAGSIVTGKMDRKIGPDRKYISFSTTMLNSGNYIRLQIISDQIPEIVHMEIEPP